MHGAVRDTIADAYAELAKASPELYFVYGEAGWPRGGRFYPHKTHRNGLSVDFFVPLRNGGGGVSSVPVWLFNGYGYLARYDKAGHGPGGTIDFEAVARHLDALSRAGAKRGVGIGRVILEVDLQRKLFATPTGAKLRGKLPFAQFKAWVPHDNHYHVDFRVPCRGGR
jgi:penicillin-insensitive murein endopeptidase